MPKKQHIGVCVNRLWKSYETRTDIYKNPFWQAFYLTLSPKTTKTQPRIFKSSRKEKLNEKISTHESMYLQ